MRITNQLLMHKADTLWDKGQFKPAIELLLALPNKTAPVLSKIEELKAIYEKEGGLPYGHPTMETIETFVQWMNDNGARFEKTRMRYYSLDYRGVHTLKTLAPQEIFLYVPRKLIITSEAGKNTHIGKKILDSGVELSWDYLVYITVFLLTQYHDPKSFWKPFMDVYPKCVDTFPMFYTPEEKKMLVGSPMHEQINEEIEEIKDEYDEIVKAVPEFKEFTFDEYIRNKTLVISRIFYVRIHGISERIMVPFAGMYF